MLPLLLLALPALQEPAVESPWTPIELFREAYPFVKGELAGQPVEWLIDTGAGATIVDKALALKLGLEGDSPIEVLGVGGGQSATMVHDVELKAGNLRVHGVRVIVTDLSEATGAFGRDLSAILGLDVLTRLTVDLDYPNRRVAFHRSDEFEYDGDGVTLPVKRAKDGNLLLQGSIEDGDPVWMDVDTGDGGTLTIHAPYAEEHGLLEGRKTATTLVGGIGGFVTGYDAAISSFTFADYEWHDVPVTFDPSEEGLFETVEGAANLGSELLSRYRVVFDVPRGVVHCERSESHTTEFRRDRTGLRALWKGDHLEVVHVSDGSPAAAAGWKEGERIVAIDGRKIGADYWQPTGGNGWNTQPAGTEVAFELADGTKRTLRLSQYY